MPMPLAYEPSLSSRYAAELSCQILTYRSGTAYIETITATAQHAHVIAKHFALYMQYILYIYMFVIEMLALLVEQNWLA